MTSLQSFQLPAFGVHNAPRAKPKPVPGKSVVKPILKKLSHSEKNSLDLDRPWGDQDEHYFYASTPVSRSSKDLGGVAFNDVIYASTASGSNTPTGTGTTATSTPARRYGHSRSISGASHVSATSNGSGGVGPRVGSTFVHPFQQTPRPDNARSSYDYSPETITEDDDAENDGQGNATGHFTSEPAILASTQGLGSQCQLSQPINPHSSSQLSLGGSRQPSLTNTQNTPSYNGTGTSTPNSLLGRANTSTSLSATPAQSSRLFNPASQPLHDSSSLLGSSTTTKTKAAKSKAKAKTPPLTTGSFPSVSLPPPPPMSPLRNSFDTSGFPRLRSKSDLDTASRAAHVREARRKFDQRERAKDEKYAREEIRKRERADKKRAQATLKEQQRQYQEDPGRRSFAAAEGGDEHLGSKHRRKISVASSGRPSLSISNRPSLAASRRDTARSSSSCVRVDAGGLDRLASSTYDDVDELDSPIVDDGESDFSQEGVDHPVPGIVHRHTTRSYAAKVRTQTTWHSFSLWARTKILRAGRR